MRPSVLSNHNINDISRKFLEFFVNHVKEIMFLLIYLSGGMSPNKAWQARHTSPVVTPMTGSLSILRPSYKVTSFNVMVASSFGKWNMCVSLLQCSTKVVTKWWLISIFPIVITLPKPASFIKCQARLSIRSRLLKVQTKRHLGPIILYVSSHTILEIWLSCKLNNDPSMGSGCGYSIVAQINEKK